MAGALFLGSCLEEGTMTTPPGASPTQMVVAFDPSRGASTPTLLYTGLQYFGNQALLLDQSADVETVKFAVSIQGSAKADKDITVNLVVDEDAADDNFANDKIEYEMLTSDQYHIKNMSGVIKAGTQYVEFEVEFYPQLIDFTKSTALPITVTNDAGITVASNFGYLYLHIIGNPIAGMYLHDFIRCSDPACAGGPDGQTFYDRPKVFSPVDPTTVVVPMGYFDAPNYIITFKNDNGVLSDFKAVIDPVARNGSWVTNSITVAQEPTIVVNAARTKFTINFTTATRNCTDVYDLQ